MSLRKLEVRQAIVCCMGAVGNDVRKDPTRPEHLEQINQKVIEFNSGGGTPGMTFRNVAILITELQEIHDKKQAELETANMWLKILLFVCFVIISAPTYGCVLVWTTFF